MDWSQLRTILWLRWRLSRNQWSRGGLLNAVLMMIVTVVLVILAIIGGVAGVVVGYFVLADKSPLSLLIAWDVFAFLFLLAWTIGLISEIQRSETIDISRMLHLPVSLRDIFFVNYLASHLTLSIILFLPWTLGLCLGLSLSRGGLMIGLVPLVLGFVFMISAWTYCLRGWLVTLMMNKRRRRAIIAGITFGFILLSQLPYILGNLTEHSKRRSPKTPESSVEQRAPDQPQNSDKLALPRGLLLAHKLVPFLWVGNGAMSLAQGNVWPAVLGAAGGFGIGALGLRRAYHSTLRFYQGQATGKKSVRKAKAEKLAIRRNLLEKQLPGVPEEAAASALAFSRAAWRAPEVKMALATNLIMLPILGVMIFARRSTALSEDSKPFIVSGAIVFLFLGMSQLVHNQFGFDRAGFRMLVLSPAPRKYILLGKNLAFLPTAFGIGFAVLVLLKIFLSISFVVLLAGVLQLLAAFLLLSMTGNLVSILVPYRIASGSLKPTKASTKTNLLIALARLSITTVLSPIFFPAMIGLLMSHVGWLPAAPANLFFSAMLVAVLFFFYSLSLTPLGNLLLQREKQILQVVTQEVE